MPTLRELEAQAKAFAPVFRGLISGAVKELRSEFDAEIAKRDARIAELEKAVSVIPESLPVEFDFEAIAEKAAALVPAPVNGVDGKDGASVSTEDVIPALKEYVEELVKAIPAARDGADGINGKDADPELVKQLVADAVAAIPVPKDGRDGTDGKDGVDGKDAIAPTVEEVAATFERRFSDLSLSWERQARDVFDKAADRMPIPLNGKDGRDALEIESFDINLDDDGRTLTFSMKRGDVGFNKSIKLACLLDRGTFSPAATYEKGDGVSYGGAFWIAKCDNPQGVPGSGETDWRRAVNRGRDGKDLRDNASTRKANDPVKIK